MQVHEVSRYGVVALNIKSVYKEPFNDLRMHPFSGKRFLHSQNTLIFKGIVLR